MTNDASQLLDDLLIRWSQWMPPFRVARGWNTRALGTEGYRSSRQYDYDNGAWDSDVEHGIMKSVDAQIVAMDDPYRAAIYVNARALVVGVSVFSSPRLPQDPQERQACIVTARCILVKRLGDAGVI